MGNMSQGEFTVREVFVGEVFGRGSIRQGTVFRESFSLGSVHEKVSVGGLSIVHIRIYQ